MAELIAISFDNVEEADRVLTELARLQKEYLIDLEDAVVAIRQPDGNVNLKQSMNLVGLGAASGGLSGAMSLREIAGGLNARGIKTARGGEWSAVQVKRVLERAGA
jgi:hypothetical protein